VGAHERPVSQEQVNRQSGDLPRPSQEEKAAKPMTIKEGTQQMTITTNSKEAWWAPEGRSRVTAALGLLVAALVVAALMLLGASSPARASTTFTVTNTTDANNTCDAGCSLREAILAANATPGADAIRFNIPGTGVKTISVASDLPDITDPLTIDGYSQPGSSLNTLAKGTNAVLMIQLDGNDTAGNGLEIVTDDVVVRGLAIGRFNFNGIEVDNVEGVGAPSGVRIQGNFVGTDASGTVARPNRFNGLNLRESGGDNTIGGTSRSQRNLISGNGANGINIGTGNDGYAIEGNLIGTKKDGTSALGNDNDGVTLSSATDNFVGEFSAAAANTIAFNGGDGVDVVGEDTVGNRILSNSIFSNGRLGIDLVGGTENAAGATANDTGDGDAGPNDLQNKPIITSAKTVEGKTTIQAKLNSTPSDPFFVQFFSNPSGNEGQTFIGEKSVSTNSNGNVTFTFTPSQAVSVGQTVTATALDVVGGNTSEFSGPRTVGAS
jgi:CSLREA domain-containing protein